MLQDPFDGPEARFIILRSQQGIWLSFVHVPAGWDVVLGEADRATALEYVENNWTDMRTGSVAELDSDG